MQNKETKYVTEQILTYYDSKIKDYIDKKAVKPQNELEKRLDAVEKSSAVNTAKIDAHREELDDIEAALLVLQNDDKQLLQEVQNKADRSDIVDLASKEFVLSKIAEAELADKDVDLSLYYTKQEVNALIPDVSNFITEQQLDDAIEKIEHPQVDLTGYATEEYVDSAIAAISKPDLSEYAKKTDIPSIEGLASETYVNEKLATITIPEVPTKISELENDLGFLTEHQDISHLATKQEVLDAIAAIPPVDLSDYAKISDLNNLQTNISNTYVTNTILEQNYTTTEQLAATYATNEKVTEIVTKEVEVVVMQELDTKVSEVVQEKVEAGDIELAANKITYGDFESDI